LRLVDTDEFLEWRRELHHSRRYWLSVLSGAVLIGGGVTWLLLGLAPIVGGIAVVAGVFSVVRLYTNRWSLDHLGRSASEIRPSLLTYLAPAALLIGGVLVVVFARASNLYTAAGLALASASIPLAARIAIRRGLNRTGESESHDDLEAPVGATPDPS
jgi:hypothetical protein